MKMKLCLSNGYPFVKPYLLQDETVSKNSLQSLIYAKRLLLFVP